MKQAQLIGRIEQELTEIQLMVRPYYSPRRKLTSGVASANGDGDSGDSISSASYRNL